MSKTIEVIRPGQLVAILVPEGKAVTATVLSVQIRSDMSLAYEVTWWSNQDRKVEWVHPSEIGDGAETMRVGFCPGRTT